MKRDPRVVQIERVLRAAEGLSRVDLEYVFQRLMTGGFQAKDFEVKGVPVDLLEPSGLPDVHHQVDKGEQDRPHQSAHRPDDD